MVGGNSSVTQIPIWFRVALTLTTKIRPKRNPFLERKPLTIRLGLTFAADLTFCHLCFPHPSIMRPGITKKHHLITCSCLRNGSAAAG